MREFQKRRLLRKIFLSRPAFVALLLVVAYLAVLVNGVYQRTREVVLKNRELERDIRDLEEKKERLEGDLLAFQSPKGVERELRDKFQIKKPGEQYVIVMEKEKTFKEDNVSERKTGFFQRLLMLVKKIF
jgi:hypothetical protein